MKIIIEVKDGIVQTVTATEDCGIYIIDHDELELAEDDLSKTNIKSLFFDEYHPDMIIDESEVHQTLQEIVNEINTQF